MFEFQGKQLIQNKDGEYLELEKHRKESEEDG